MKIKSSIVSVASWIILSFWIANACFGGIFMKEIKLTQGYVALVDDSDYEYLSKWKWCVCVRRHGTVFACRGQWIGNGKTKIIQMHRLIMGLTDPKIQIDHIDMNPLNNQRHNMRTCTHRQNQYNKPSRGGASKYKGVSWFKRYSNWRVQIAINGKNAHVGYYAIEKDAALAYNEAAIKHFGEFARLNEL